MKIRRFICAVLMLGAMITTQSASAQLKTSYFMEGSYFRTDLNPALVPTRGYIAISHLSGYTFGSYSNYASNYNFLYERNGEIVDAYSPLVSASEFLSKLPNKCMRNDTFDLNIFKLGFYTLNGTFWNIGSTFRLNHSVSIPKKYFEILKGQYDDRTKVENMKTSTNAYIENFIGRTFQVGDNITIGAKLKFLIGIANNKLNIDTISVQDDSFVIKGDTKIATIFYDSSRYDGDVFPEVLTSSSLSSIMDNVKNFGGAIDIGAEMRLMDDKLKVSAAITDLGFIRWSEDTMKEGRFEQSFKSADALHNISINEDIVDAPRFFTSYTSRLTTNINLAGEFNFLNNHFSVGLLSNTRLLYSAVMTELTASFNVRPTNWFSVTASHTFLNRNTPGIYGAAINIHPRAINLFLGFDYISGATGNDLGTTLVGLATGEDAYTKANSFNFYMGIGFNFGRPDFLIE